MWLNRGKRACAALLALAFFQLSVASSTWKSAEHPLLEPAEEPRRDEGLAEDGGGSSWQPWGTRSLDQESRSQPKTWLAHDSADDGLADESGLQLANETAGALLAKDARRGTGGAGPAAATPRANGTLLIEKEKAMRAATVPDGYNTNNRPGFAASTQDKVSLSATLSHFYGIDNHELTFHSVIMTTMKWVDSRLAFDSTASAYNGAGSYAAEPEDIWTPSLTYLNQVEQPAEVRVRHVEVYENGTVVHEERINVICQMPQDGDPFKMFPFDNHKVYVEATSFPYSASEVLITAPDAWETEDHSKAQREVNNPQWVVGSFDVTYQMQKTTVSAMDSTCRMEMKIERKPASILLMTVVPLIVVCIYALTSFFTPGYNFESRQEILGTSVLTIIGVLWIMTEVLPPVTYLVWLHYYAITSLLIVLLSLVAVTLIHFVDPEGGSFKAEEDFEKAVIQAFQKAPDHAKGSLFKRECGFTSSSVRPVLPTPKDEKEKRKFQKLASTSDLLVSPKGESKDDWFKPIKMTFAKGLEEEKIKQSFDVYDTDKSGKLQGDEIENLLRTLNASEEECQSLREKMDEDGNEDITFKEFKQYVQNSSGSRSSQIFREKIFIAANKIQNKLDMKYEQLKNDHILMDRQVCCCFSTNDAPGLNTFLCYAVPIAWIMSNLVLGIWAVYFNAIN